MTTPELSTIQTDEDIDRLLAQITNWGRWGKQDQLGTANFITARQRLQARPLSKGVQGVGVCPWRCKLTSRSAAGHWQ